MRASSIPGPVRVALTVDAGIAAVYGTAAVVGVPGGRLGTVLVGGEAAVWAVVVLGWVFPTFWSRWSAAVERVFLAGPGVDDDPATPVRLAPWPSATSIASGGAVLAALVAVQSLTSSGTGVPFRSVVTSYVVAGGLGAALLAIASDVSSLVARTRSDG